MHGAPLGGGEGRSGAMLMELSLVELPVDWLRNYSEVLGFFGVVNTQECLTNHMEAAQHPGFPFGNLHLTNLSTVV